jgi:tetratricopeptide (TPR) repeat protein
VSAEAQAALGDLDAAAQAHRDSILAADRNHGLHSPHAVIARVWYGQFLLTASQPRQAATLLAESLAIVEAWPESSNKTIFAQKVITEALGAYVRLGWLAEAQALALRGVGLSADKMQNRSFAVRFLINRAALQLELGEFAATRQGLDSAGSSIDRDGLAGHAVNVKTYGPTRVRLHAELGEAAPALDALRAWQKSSGRPDTWASDDLIGLHAAAMALLAHGDAAQATQMCERGLETIEQHPHRASVAEAEANLLALLGRARLAQGDAYRAVDALRRAEALHREIFDAEHTPALARVQVACGEAFMALRDRTAALDMLGRAQAIHQRHARLGPQHLAPLQGLESALAARRGEFGEG